MEDAAKPVSFNVSLEEILRQIFHLGRHYRKALVQKFATIGIYDPTELVKAWKVQKIDKKWLSTEVNI